MRASESRLRAMLEAALDAVVTMDADGRVIGWNRAAEAIFGYSRERGDRPRDGGADRAASPSRRAPARARALPRDRRGRRPRPPARADRHAQRRHRVPGRADDHADRAARAADVHRATCATSPTACRPTGSCARRARASSRSPTPSAGGSSATCTTARSSGSPSVLLDLGRSARRPGEQRRAARRRDRRARGRPARRSASSRAACTRRCSPSAGSRRRSRRSRCARPLPVELEIAARPAAARADRGGRLLRRRRGARQRPEARRRGPRGRARRRSTTSGSTSASPTTASAARIRRARPARARRPGRGARREAHARQPRRRRDPASRRGPVRGRRRSALPRSLRLEPRLGPVTVGASRTSVGRRSDRSPAAPAVVSAPRHCQSR